MFRQLGIQTCGDMWHAVARSHLLHSAAASAECLVHHTAACRVRIHVAILLVSGDRQL